MLLPSGVRSFPEKVTKGHTEVQVSLEGDVPQGATQVAIQPSFTSIAGQTVLFDPILLTLDSIAILKLAPDPAWWSDRLKW